MIEGNERSGCSDRLYRWDAGAGCKRGWEMKGHFLSCFCVRY
jgi:hypothetical protein